MDVREKLVELPVEDAILILREEHRQRTDGYATYLEHGGKGDHAEEVSLDALAMAISALEKTKWISVKEHLPQENDPEGTVCELVQVLLVNGDVSTGWCNRRTKLWWHFSYGESDFIDYDYGHTPVIAWQPLAQPPKGE